MGMEKAVRFPTAPPAWEAARDILVARGHMFEICMIDGQLSFPDEQPSESWSELRIKTPQGMITVRRESNRLLFVTWGNADARLLEQWDTLATAFAEAGDGAVETIKT